MGESVGILTLSASDNCGSLLQTYALQYILETRFHKRVTVLDFDSLQSRTMYNIIPPQPMHHPKQTLRGMLFYKVLKKQKDDYNQFRSRYLRLSEEKYYDLEFLRKADGAYDYIVTGSDQVWNIHMPDFDEAFLLDWVKKSKKVAYAPSLGGSDFADYPDQEALKGNLESYHALSTREIRGREAVKTVTGREIPILADPTLLVEKAVWDNLAGERMVQEPYIFFYSWAYDNYRLNHIVEDYAKEHGLKVYVINASRWLRHKPQEFGFTLFPDGGPKVFLNLMKYAQKVFVESFHGVIFANKFERDFYFLDNHEPGVLDPRLDSILTLYDRKDRVVRCGEDISHDSIDYEKVSPAYEALVERSMDYIDSLFTETQIHV